MQEFTDQESDAESSNEQAGIPKEKQIIGLAKSERYHASDKNRDLWNAFNQLIKKTSSEPTSLLLIIFIAFLLGSVFRAFPVEWAEKLGKAISNSWNSLRSWKYLKFHLKCLRNLICRVFSKNFKFRKCHKFKKFEFPYPFLIEKQIAEII